MKLKKITDYLNKYLEIETFSDASANGLQVENSGKVKKVGLAVDASLEIIEKAAAEKCGLLIVHHGLFWGKQNLLTDNHYKRVKALISGDIALYAAHLPLDAHPKTGNNAQIAKKIGLHNIEPFALYNGKNIGMMGKFKKNKTLKEAIASFEKQIGVCNNILNFGPKEISSVGVVSGSATDIDLFKEVKNLGIDILISGEPKYEAYYLAQEIGLNIFYGGHYMTETFGVKALGKVLKKKMDINTIFFDIKCTL
jgi:dinuclear metal center YbgI/SA1388 family protein